MTLYVLDSESGHYRFRPANENDVKAAGLVREGELELLRMKLEAQTACRGNRSCEWCGCAQR